MNRRCKQALEPKDLEQWEASDRLCVANVLRKVLVLGHEMYALVVFWERTGKSDT